MSTNDLPAWVTWPERRPQQAAVVTKVCLVLLVIIMVLIMIGLSAG